MKVEVMGLWVLLHVVVLLLSSSSTTPTHSWVMHGFEDFNVSQLVSTSAITTDAPPPVMVPLTLIHGADAKGAVCLDGTLPGYHFHPGYGSGANSWLIQLEGGGWCNTIRSCVYRKTTRRGSSNYMEKKLPFTGILSSRAEENPDFFNWNRVKLRYCDGASFAGEGQNEALKLNFRGQRIWLAGIEELMSKGMRQANQALLSGCSAGGLASILHCDEFRELFPTSTKVKCLSDAGFFLDAVDVSGGHTLRNMFQGVVSLQNVGKNLPQSCTNHMDPTSCFFPQNLVANIKTPLFLLNAAYDAWQLQESLAPPSADPHGSWRDCKRDHAKCTASQVQFLQDFRNEMLSCMKGFSMSKGNGLFINSCFAHCQTERQDTWFSDDSPLIQSKMMHSSKSVTNALPEKDMLNDKNYEVWLRKARLLLTEREVLDVITDTVQEPEQDAMTQAQYREAQKDFTAFLKRDAIGRVVLLGTMRNDLMLRYDHFDTAKEVWDNVKLDLGGTMTAQLRRLQMSFDRFVKLPHTSMTRHLTIMKNMITELAQAGHRMTDEQQVQAVIRSLPKSWENFRVILTHDDNVTNFAQVQKKCELEEQRLINEKSIVAEANVVNSKKRKAPWNPKKGKGQGKGKAKASGSQPQKKKKPIDKAEVECFRCHKLGHFARECPEPEIQPRQTT